MITEQRRSMSLEARLQDTEDKLDIFNLIASHPPIIDSGQSDYVSAVWMADGVFDSYSRQRVGAEAIAEAMSGPEVGSARDAGLSHFCGLPHVIVTGDTAHAIVYLQLVGPDTEREPVDVPNHKRTRGYRVHNVLVNRWDFVRTAAGWRIKRRAIRLIDGSEPARDIMRGTFEARP